MILIKTIHEQSEKRPSLAPCLRLAALMTQGRLNEIINNNNNNNNNKIYSNIDKINSADFTILKMELTNKSVHPLSCSRKECSSICVQVKRMKISQLSSHT